MTIFKWHHHIWWLLKYAIYAPEGKVGTAASWTMLTYVCRNDRSHVKQVRLQGEQETVAERIFERQRDDQGVGAIPDAFKKAWEKQP